MSSSWRVSQEITTLLMMSTDLGHLKNAPKRSFGGGQANVAERVAVWSWKRCSSKSNFERTVSLVETTDSGGSGQLDQQIKSMMDSTENYITRKSGARKRAFICKVCGKEAEDSDMRRHIEASHISNVSHSCDICGKTSRSKNGLRQHLANVHRN